MGRYLISAACAVLLLVLAKIPDLCFSANSSMPSSSPPCIERERRALLQFKASLYDPSNWLSSWEGDHCCQWEGIGCDNLTGHVVMLDLSTPYVKCRRSLEPYGRYYYYYMEWEKCEELDYILEAADVNTSLLQLEYLTHLDLSGNYFNDSPIPTFIGSMQRLRYLSLSGSPFTGSSFGGRIPSNLGNLTNLEYLDMSWKDFSSSDISWISELQSLEHLDMTGCYYGNNTLKLLEVYFSNASQLQVLNLGNNGLTLLDLDALQNMTSSLVHLDLSWNNLTSVPSWFANFEKLEFIDLSFCGLYGPIPYALRNLTSIESLYLSGNEFDSVPSWFLKFEKLKLLDLSSNRFRGPIPDAIRNMTSIQFLFLGVNHFSVVPSWFVQLKTLVLLDLSSNELTSMECSLASILGNMCHLKILDLSRNMLQKEPIGHNKFSACIRYDLEILDLSYSGFSDDLPSWLGHFENLKSLYLNENMFGGLIPISFRKLTRLRNLDLSNNKLEGSLYNMGQLVDLIRLDLSNNFFNGTIPQNFGQLVNLTELDFSNNYLYGTLPQSVVQLVSLHSLDLSNNHFNDTLLQSLVQLVSLQDLDLSNNLFSGTFPQSLDQFVKLDYLNLSSNELHGSIPVQFGQLVNLHKLDLSSNNLDGIITLGKNLSSIMPNLYYLDLSNNQISGSLPVHIGHTMPNMDSLLLGNNLINGSIPDTLCQTELRRLDISNNRLSGEIPNCWRDHYFWDEINLSSNKLSGVFPTSFWNLSSLLWLHLNNNRLHGELPMYEKKLMKLLILDVGENRLSGNIPSWTSDSFPILQVLRLRQNMFNGSIPLQLCQFSTLKILDLSRNNLQGSIPWCIGNLRGMTLQTSDKDLAPNISFAVAPAGAPVEAPAETLAEPPLERWSSEDVKQVMKGMELEYTKNLVLVVNMDLSENKLVGVIPAGVTLLNGLHGLNLYNNHLKGEIPKMIADMKSLESFDVSNNQLSGTIPSTMQGLTSLSHLNLAHNNFSGPIPTGNQFSTYDPSIYAGNPYLCGLALPKKCPGDGSPQVPLNRGFEEDEDGKASKLEKWLFYFVVAAGFATGFWGVVVFCFSRRVGGMLTSDGWKI